jgi:hypothetical protein
MTNFNVGEPEMKMLVIKYEKEEHRYVNMRACFGADF